MTRRPFALILASCFSFIWTMPQLAAETAYQTYADMTSALQSWSKSSKNATLSSLGKTREGRDIWLMTVSEGEANKKPALLVMGNLDAPLIAGSELCVQIARNISKDAGFSKFRKQFTFYFIPRPSPDATEFFFSKLKVLRERNTRKQDDDRDGEIDEDGPEDLNGDGIISTMRITDPTGEWMVYKEDPRVMIKADPFKNEKGQYRLIPSEGFDNDKDEQFNEDGPGGVVFNKNFTFEYPYFQVGAGPHQVSEPETRAIADFAFSKENIFAVFSFSGDDNLNHPWKDDPKAEKEKEKKKVLKNDKQVIDYIVKEYKKVLPKKGAPNSSDGKGSFVRWSYFHYGRWSFAAQPWWFEIKKKEDAKKKEEAKKPEDKKGKKDNQKGAKDDSKKDLKKRAEKQLQKLKYIDTNKLNAFVPWTEVSHPDFPNQKVEVGGFHPTALLNPKVEVLKPIAEKHSQFLKSLLELAPKLTFSDVKVEALGDKHYRIEVEIRNDGFLPTSPKMAEVNRIPRPLQLHLELEGETKWLVGYSRTLLGRIKGSGGKHKQSFLIQTEAKQLQLKLESPTSGSIEKKVEIK